MAHFRPTTPMSLHFSAPWLSRTKFCPIVGIDCGAVILKLIPRLLEFLPQLRDPSRRNAKVLGCIASSVTQGEMLGDPAATDRHPREPALHIEPGRRDLRWACPSVLDDELSPVLLLRAMPVAELP